MLLSASCRTQERDPLGGGECLEGSLPHDGGGDTRSPFESRELSFDRLRQRLLKERARFERVRQVAEILMELGELSFEVVEAAEHRLLVHAPDQADHLFAKQANVLCECVHLLERTVVQVESQAHEKPLVRRSQPRFVCIGHRVGSCARGGYAEWAVSAATRPERYA